LKSTSPPAVPIGAAPPPVDKSALPKPQVDLIARAPRSLTPEPPKSKQLHPGWAFPSGLTPPCEWSVGAHAPQILLDG